MERTSFSERQVCRALSISRSVKRYVPVKRDDEDAVTAAIIELATNYGRYGYRRVAAMLPTLGFEGVNHKRVERIWREQSLKVPAKQPKRRRIWTDDGSCVRLRPGYENHVWSYDFVEDRLDNGSEFVAGKLRDYLASASVTTLFIEPGSPWEIRVLRELQLQDAR